MATQAGIERVKRLAQEAEFGTVGLTDAIVGEDIDRVAGSGPATEAVLLSVAADLLIAKSQARVYRFGDDVFENTVELARTQRALGVHYKLMSGSFTATRRPA